MKPVVVVLPVPTMPDTFKEDVFVTPVTVRLLANVDVVAPV